LGFFNFFFTIHNSYLVLNCAAKKPWQQLSAMEKKHFGIPLQKSYDIYRRELSFV